MKIRLDRYLAEQGLVPTRSQAESMIRLGQVSVGGKVIKKAGWPVDEGADIKLLSSEQYVSRAGLKLSSAASKLGLEFKDKVVLDVGSSTGGFSDYALQHEARKVIAVDVGTNQLHPSLRDNSKVELHEQTDIRDMTELSEPADMVVIDVSFISLRDILPSVRKLTPTARIVAMVKPQFESADQLKHKGVVKNDTMRRQILKSFEDWAKNEGFVIQAKADSEVAGEKGNQERFYLLKITT